MELNEILSRLESRYGSISEVVGRLSLIDYENSCDGQFSTVHCDGCNGHCSGQGWMD